MSREGISGVCERIREESCGTIDRLSGAMGRIDASVEESIEAPPNSSVLSEWKWDRSIGVVSG